RWPEQAEAALHRHFAPTFNITDESMSQDALVDVLTAYDGIASWSSDRIDAGVIAAASGGRAKIIANFGVGVD
ncbi:MAG: D-glycerate dehydrogenase, partial [Candidatus Puniceispirillum sp.]